MNDRLSIFVYAHDPISQAGIVAQLEAHPDVDVTDVDHAAVALVVADETDDETIRVIRGLQRNGCPRVVLIATKVDDVGLLAAVEAGACGLMRRSDATPDAIVAAVRAASGGDGT